MYNYCNKEVIDRLRNDLKVLHEGLKNCCIAQDSDFILLYNAMCRHAGGIIEENTGNVGDKLQELATNQLQSKKRALPGGHNDTARLDKHSMGERRLYASEHDLICNQCTSMC